ncbi:hypothetical protein [Nocardia sp. bgisy134]|uniref:hypothetical protein n=1 Tax=Nocardia sp. bgisy134 TaxID=3413789 RepID=UPI003D71700C
MSIDVVDRIVLRDGGIAANDTYFDSASLVPRLLAHPILSLKLLPRFFPTAAERAASRKHSRTEGMQPVTTTPTTGVRADALDRMAIGRLVLAAISLTAPRQFARAVGIKSSPELTYLTRIYGARALVMGLGYLTGSEEERARWKRFGLVVDTSDTLTGIAQLVRRDVPVRAAVSMLALTGSYAAVGAAEVVSDRRR